MKVTEPQKSIFPFRDHYKQTSKQNKNLKKIIKKDKPQPPKTKDGNFIGWA